LIYGKEALNLREVQGMRDVRSQGRTRKLNRYTKGEKMCWNIYRRCHLNGLPSKFYILNR
jgi:hypothetical protein